MVNNIAANVLGGAAELEGELETGGTHLLHSTFPVFFLKKKRKSHHKCSLWPFYKEVFSLYCFNVIKPTWPLLQELFYIHLLTPLFEIQVRQFQFILICAKYLS